MAQIRNSLAESMHNANYLLKTLFKSLLWFQFTELLPQPTADI